MHDVVKYEIQKGNFENYDAVILLQPTSPLRDSVDIDKACKIFMKNKADSLVSIKQIEHTSNPESLYNKKKFLKRINNLNKISLRQKKKNYYAPNGAAIYITKLSKIKIIF